MPLTQAQRDQITYDMYVDCNCDAAAAAHQLGIDRRTVRAAIRRVHDRQRVA